jgi:hypothetical protein
MCRKDRFGSEAMLIEHGIDQSERAAQPRRSNGCNKQVFYCSVRFFHWQAATVTLGEHKAKFLGEVAKTVNVRLASKADGYCTRQWRPSMLTPTGHSYCLT